LNFLAVSITFWAATALYDDNSLNIRRRSLVRLSTFYAVDDAAVADKDHVEICGGDGAL
jgi:hypothetical protein